jgi:hypothetical protein
MYNVTKNGCSIIEPIELLKAVRNLPSRDKVNGETKTDTLEVVIDVENENSVLFDWDEKCNGWRLRNRIVFIPNNGYHNRECKVCKTHTRHIINKNLDKLKCLTCNTVIPYE